MHLRASTFTPSLLLPASIVSFAFHFFTGTCFSSCPSMPSSSSLLVFLLSWACSLPLSLYLALRLPGLLSLSSLLRHFHSSCFRSIDVLSPVHFLRLHLVHSMLVSLTAFHAYHPFRIISRSLPPMSLAMPNCVNPFSILALVSPLSPTSLPPSSFTHQLPPSNRTNQNTTLLIHPLLILPPVQCSFYHHQQNSRPIIQKAAPKRRQTRTRKGRKGTSGVRETCFVGTAQKRQGAGAGGRGRRRREEGEWWDEGCC